MWQAAMKRAAKSFSSNRTVYVIWIRFVLHFRSRVKLFSRIQWPTHCSAHISNQPFRIHVSATSVADSSSDSERCFLQLFLFCYVVNPFSRSELQCHFSNAWQNQIWKQNQESLKKHIIIHLKYFPNSDCLKAYS